MADFLRLAPVIPPISDASPESYGFITNPSQLRSGQAPAGTLKQPPANPAPLLRDPGPSPLYTQDEVAGMHTGTFVKGLRSGVRGGEANRYMTMAIEASAAGDHGRAAMYRDLALQAQQQAAAMSPPVTDYRDVHDLGSAYEFAAGAAGQGLGSTLPSLAGGAAGMALATGAAAMTPGGRALLARGGLRSPAALGSIAGATIPGYQMERDEAVMTAAQDPRVMATRAPQEILNAAAAKGAINMIPETIAPALGSAMLAKRVVKPFARATMGTVAKDVAATMASEGGTEALQEKVGQLAHGHLNPERDTSNDTADIVNAGLMGAISGPVLGAHGHLANLAGVALTRTKDKAVDTGEAVLDKGKQLGESLGEVLSGGRYGERLDELTADRVPQDVISRGREAIAASLGELDMKRAGELVRELKDRANDSVLGQKARDLLAKLEDPKQRAAALDEAKRFVVEDLRGKQAAERAKGLYASAQRAAKDFYAGWKDEGTKKNAQRELDATDRALDALLQPAFEGSGDEGRIFAAVLRDVIRDPLKNKAVTVNMITEAGQYLGQDAQNVLAQVHEILQRDGADEKTLKSLGKLIGKLDTHLKDLANEPAALSTAYQRLMPSSQREAVVAALGRPLSGGDFNAIARRAVAVYDKGADPQPVRDFFGPNADKALKLAEAAVANRKPAESMLEVAADRAPQGAGPDSDEQVKSPSDDSEEFVAKQDELARAAARTDEVYSFRDGRTRATKNPYGPLYDVKADAELIAKRLDPEGALARLYRDQSARVPVLLTANEYVDRMGLDRRQLAQQYTKETITDDNHARRVLEGKAVIEAKPMTSGDPTEMDRNAVERVTSGQNAYSRPTREADAKRKDSRYFVVPDKGVTNITNAGPEEGMLWLRAADADGNPATHNGEPKYLRLDVNRLVREMLARENAMRRLQAPTEETLSLGEKYLKAAMDGLVGLLTTHGNGVHGESGVFAYRKGNLREVIMGNAKSDTNVRSQPILPYDLKLTPRFTVGSVLGISEEQYKQRVNALLRSPEVLKAKGEAFRALAATPEYQEEQAHQKLVEAEARKQEGPRFDDADLNVDYLFDQDLETQRQQAETAAVAKEVGKRTAEEPVRRERVNAMPANAGPQQSGMQPASLVAKRKNLQAIEARIERLKTSPDPAAQALVPKLERAVERLSASIDADIQKRKTAEAKPGSPEYRPPKQVAQMTQAERDAERGKTQLAAQDERTESPNEHPLRDRKAAEEYVHRALGKKIDLVFKKTLGGHSGEWTQGDTVNTIRISLNAGPGVLSTAFHESMHEFFDRLGKWGQGDTKELLTRVAGNPMITRQLERLLAEHPAAAAAMRASPEERLAYAYQFWASAKHGGPKFTVGPETDGFFAKIRAFFREILGMMSEDEKAEQIFQQFYDGKLATKNAAGKVIAGSAAIENRGKSIRDLVGPPVKAMMRHIMPGHDRMLESGNAKLVEIAKLFHNMPTTAGGGEGQGYLNARPQMTNVWLADLNEILKNYDEETVKLAGQHLTGVKAGMPAYGPARELVEKTREFLSRRVDKDGKDTHFLKYLQDAGVPVKKLADFFPRVWNMNTIAANQKEFHDLLIKHHEKELTELAQYSYEKALKNWEAYEDNRAQNDPDYVRFAKLSPKEQNALIKKGIKPPSRADFDHEKVATNIVLTLSAQNGVLDESIEKDLEVGKTALGEGEGRLGFTPYMAAINERKLKFLDMTKFGKFVHQDYMAIMGSYIEQGVRRAEYARRFGNQGEKLRSMLNEARDIEVKRLLEGRKIAELKPEQKKELFDKADKEIASYNKEIMAMEGTLGHDLSPTSRKWIGYAMVYQNARILPLALMSSFIDAQGVMVRGGTVGDAMRTFQTGVRELYASFSEAWRGEKGKAIADEARNNYWTRFSETMGTVDNAVLQDALNQAYTGMYMYGGAKRLNDKIFKWNGMEAWNRGMRIGATQAAVGFFKEQLQNPGEHTARWLEELGVRKEDLQLNADGTLKFTREEGLTDEQASRLRAGLQKWVDSAILRPNSAQRPAWASDPHWALIFHLKQFTYSFHTTILRQVIKEAKHGNFGPALSLASYIPVMLAADILRGMIQTGGGEPPWKQDWGPGEYLSYATQRAGVFGIGQFAKDAVEYGPWTLGGPTADQVINGIVDPLDKTVMAAVPANPLFKNMIPSQQMD